MRNNKRHRLAFRPDLNGASLEDRVVLATAPGFTFVTQQQVAQLHSAFSRAFRATEFGIRKQLQAEARQLFASGTPTAQQLADFQARANGIIAAGATSLASMSAILPNSQRRLVPSTVRAILGNGQGSLLSRVNNVINNSNATSSLSGLQTAIRQNVRAVLGNVHAQTAQFFANQDFNRAVMFANDGSQSLSQFLGDRIITQFANNLGNLAVAFPTVANSVLFANGATTASPAAVQQFNQMTTPALGLAASILGNELQLLPNGASIIPALQTSLFGTTTSTTTPTSLIAALQALPATSAGFASAFPTAFSTGFTNPTGVLSPFVGTFPTPTFTLPTTISTGVFSPTFTGSTFQNGFLGGFGSGSLGFGVAPTAFNTNFGTGFNNFVSNANTGLGFITPPITVSTGTGTGVVGTVGVTTGTGTPVTTGTGTGVVGTVGATPGTGTITTVM